MGRRMMVEVYERPMPAEREAQDEAAAQRFWPSLGSWARADGITVLPGEQEGIVIDVAGLNPAIRFLRIVVE